MKKIFIIIAMMFLISCNNNNDTFEAIPVTGEIDLYVDVYDEMKMELYEMPDEFDIDEEYDEKIIIVPLDIKKFVKSQIDFLYEEISKGNEISRIIVEYTDEGDPILKYVKYDGNRIFIVTDTTRDEFGKPTYDQKSFKTIKYETDGYRHRYFAVDDKDYTYEEIKQSWDENDNQTGIDFYPILMFMRHDIDKDK